MGSRPKLFEEPWLLEGVADLEEDPPGSDFTSRADSNNVRYVLRILSMYMGCRFVRVTRRTATELHHSCLCACSFSDVFFGVVSYSEEQNGVPYLLVCTLEVLWTSVQQEVFLQRYTKRR